MRRSGTVSHLSLGCAKSSLPTRNRRVPDIYPSHLAIRVVEMRGLVEKRVL